MRKNPDLTGQVFGKLTALRPSPDKVGSKRNPGWICRCSCNGNEKAYIRYWLLNGSVLSCGCVKKERGRKMGQKNRTHGQSGDGNRRPPEYAAWCGAKNRCLYPANPSYASYGGRGIKFCERWLNSFENFLSDVGPRPSNRHSLDRWPNNDGNYEPGNVRWATIEQQNDNRRKYGSLYTFSDIELLSELKRRFPTINLSQFQSLSADSQISPKTE